MSDNVPARPRPLSREQVLEWLNYQMEPLITRRDQTVIPALVAMAEAHPVIEDEETAGRFTENIAMARELIADATVAHREQKAPYFDGGRAVDGWKNDFIQTVSAALQSCTAIALAYADQKEAAARARLAAEAEAARQRAEAEVQRNAFLRQADAAVKEARRADIEARAKPAELSRQHGEYGAISSITQTWTYRVTNAALVPRQFLCVDDRAVKLAMKVRDAAGKPRGEIPGIEWVANRSLGVR